MFELFAFLIGSSIMSFINVVVYRSVRGIDFIYGRSFCVECKKELSCFDMIPVFSYIFLRGKCRYCKSILSFREFIYEIIGGFIGLWCYMYYGCCLQGLVVFCFCFMFILISRIDYQTMIIFDWCHVLLFIIGLFYVSNTSYIDKLIGLFIISVPLLVINKIFVEGFGGGDIKLLGVMGLVLGYKLILIAFVIAVVSASLYALILIFFNKLQMNEELAFGPFICLGLIVVIIYGYSIVNLYTWL